MKVLNPYFLIKVPKQEENDKREKEGNLYLHPSFVWLTRNTQCGIIVDISPEAHKQLPEARVDDILIVHHFAQGSHSKLEPDKKYLVFEDETYNYYKIVSKEIPGINNQCYGVYTNGTIIPNKDYVFLEPMPKEENEYGYRQTAEDVLQKIKDIKNEIEYLGKGTQSKDKSEHMMKRQKEMSVLSASIHKKEFIKFKVAYTNSSLGINNNSLVYGLNIGCKTEISFMGNSYIVAETKFISSIV